MENKILYYILDIFLITLEILQLFIKSLVLLFANIFRKFVSSPRKSVAGDIVLITGAGHGLGRELALRFSKLGSRLVLLDINKENVYNVASEIKNDGGVGHAYQCDISDNVEVEKVAQRIRNEIGDVTILINNAGILNCQPILSLTSQQIRRTFEINLMAHYWTIRQFLPQMLDAGKGHIVAIASIGSFVGSVNMTDYCASKFGVRGLMEALSEELHAIGKDKTINLTTICPIFFNSGLVHKPLTRFPKLFPILTVEEVAEATMDAILSNTFIKLLPSSMDTFMKLLKLLPRKVNQMIVSFSGYGAIAHNSGQLLEH